MTDRPPHTFIIAPSKRQARLVQTGTLRIHPKSRNVTHVTNGVTARAKLAGYRPDHDVVWHVGFPVHDRDRQEIVEALKISGAPTERRTAS